MNKNGYLFIAAVVTGFCIGDGIQKYRIKKLTKKLEDLKKEEEFCIDILNAQWELNCEALCKEILKNKNK